MSDVETARVCVVQMFQRERESEHQRRDEREEREWEVAGSLYSEEQSDHANRRHWDACTGGLLDSLMGHTWRRLII